MANQPSSHTINQPPGSHACAGCSNADELDFEFEYAYQPIVNLKSRTIFAHEALIRGPRGEDAYSVLNRVNADNIYRFDQACRVKAVKTAAELKLDGCLSINFYPNAVYRPELCIRTTLDAASRYDFAISNIIFEFTEVEKIHDTVHLLNIVTEYKKLGFQVAIDDFGAGYAGLNLLAKFQPDIIKLDMDLIRGIAADKHRQAIVKALIQMCTEMDMQIIAEGVESLAERDFLLDHGIWLMQGFFFCKPAFQAAGHVESEKWA